jgi:hypothetical protein
MRNQYLKDIYPHLFTNIPDETISAIKWSMIKKLPQNIEEVHIAFYSDRFNLSNFRTTLSSAGVTLTQKLEKIIRGLYPIDLDNRSVLVGIDFGYLHRFGSTNKLKLGLSLSHDRVMLPNKIDDFSEAQLFSDGYFPELKQKFDDQKSMGNTPKISRLIYNASTDSIENFKLYSVEADSPMNLLRSHTYDMTSNEPVFTELCASNMYINIRDKQKFTNAFQPDWPDEFDVHTKFDIISSQRESTGGKFLHVEEIEI